MEDQTQLTPDSQVLQKPSKLLVALIAVLFVLLTGTLVYYMILLNQQSHLSSQIILKFSQCLEEKQFTDAGHILETLNQQRLGSYLSETQTEIDRLLAVTAANISGDILKEEDQNLATYQTVKDIQLLKAYPGMQKAINDEAQKAAKEYTTGKIEYKQISYYFLNLAIIGFSGDEIEKNKELVENCRESREAFQLGMELLSNGDYLGSLEKLVKITPEDQADYEAAKQAISEGLSKLDTQEEKLLANCRYTEAEENLNRLQTIFPQNQDIAKRISSIETARQGEQENLVLYTGSVQHIFFHPLIAYPQLTFDGDLQAQGFNEWFVTVPEFKKMIESIYAKGFILINLSDIYEKKTVEDKEILAAKQLFLPKGKKPLVLSIDDLNYYRYMVQNGIVNKLIVDKEGKIATYSKNPQGKEVIDYDNEIVPILDSFVSEHPDFSFHGTKGVIALTGYEGILGYRTNELDSPGYSQEKEKALKLVQALKEDGWFFASHGYGHLNTRDFSYERIVQDTNRWLKEVGTLIGPTDVYIYPFGASVKPDDPKFKYLQSAGFKIFCSVGPNPYLKFSEQYVLMDRRHIDGIALWTQADSLRDLFDSEKLIDPLRPPLRTPLRLPQ